jgi:hypothetical protein
LKSIEKRINAIETRIKKDDIFEDVKQIIKRAEILAISVSGGQYESVKKES